MLGPYRFGFEHALVVSRIGKEVGNCVKKKKMKKKKRKNKMKLGLGIGRREGEDCNFVLDFWATS